MSVVVHTPADALERLWSGNRRWALAPRSLPPVVAPEGAPRLAVVVTCSDLAAAPETIFGVRAGELIVAQTPGGWVDEDVAATVDFGVRCLGVGLVVVLAHESCAVLDTSPAAMPTTAVGRSALRAVTGARACAASAVESVAREGVRRIERQLELPRDVVVTGAVLRRDGTVERL